MSSYPVAFQSVIIKEEIIVPDVIPEIINPLKTDQIKQEKNFDINEQSNCIDGVVKAESNSWNNISENKVSSFHEKINAMDHIKQENDFDIYDVKIPYCFEDDIKAEPQSCENISDNEVHLQLPENSSTGKHDVTTLSSNETDHIIHREMRVTEPVHDMRTNSYSFKNSGTKYTTDCDKSSESGICSEKFISDINFAPKKKKLGRHMKIDAGERSYNCNVCSKKLSSERGLIKHLRNHTRDKPYFCNFCDKKFSWKSTLDQHLRTHNGEKRYKCDICNQKCSFKSDLEKHMRVHTGEKPYNCSVCDKNFSQKSTLDQHTKLHTGDKPHKCEVCGLKWSHKSNLINHTRVHTGERPFNCIICGKKFSRKTTLGKHSKIHTREKQYNFDVYAAESVQII